MPATQPPPAPSALQAFEAWAAVQRSAGLFKKPASERVYSGMWRAWSEWLQARELPWQHISAQQISEFLSGPAPGQRNRRSPRNPHQMSNYTRQRYWHLLESVYQCATAQGWLPRNPATELAAAERPRIQERSRQAQVLPPGTLELLRSADVLRQITAQEHDSHWWRLRDRAAIALMAHTGLSSSEVLALQGRDLREHNAHASNAPGAQLSLPGCAPNAPSLWLDVREDAQHVGRSLALPEPLAQALRPWLARRQRLLAERHARASPVLQRNAYLREHDRQGALFPSREAADAHDPLPPMRAHTLHLMVTRTLNALYAHPLGAELDKRRDGVQVAHGSAIIRNSVIRHWLNTLGVEQALALAGLKNESALRLLAHTTTPSTPQQNTPNPGTVHPGRRTGTHT